MTALLRPADPPANYPVLPSGLHRSHVEALLPTIRRRFGLSTPCAMFLVLCIQQTRPSDWTSASAEPVCYVRQGLLAAQLGLTPRAVRFHEATLERAGLIARTTAGNGSRGRYAGGAVVQGLCLTPLLCQVPMLMDEAEDFAAEQAHELGLRRQISAARRLLKRRVEELLTRHPKVELTADLLTLLAALPRRFDGLTRDVLESLLGRLDEALHRPLPETLCRHDSTGLPEPDFRPYIQATSERTSVNVPEQRNQDSNVGPSSDGPHEDDKAARRPAAVNTGPQGQPDLSRDARAASDPTPLPPMPLSPRRLHAAAGPDFRLYLDAIKGDRPVPSELDFVRAAIGILPEMGINPSAWDEAATALGDLGAALAVLVIEARRHDAAKPIRNPGGSLRAFARLAEKGQLNLMGSLIGLMERSSRT